MALHSRFLQIVTQNESVSRCLIGHHDLGSGLITPPLQMLDQLAPPRPACRKRLSFRLILVMGYPGHQSLDVRVTSNEYKIVNQSEFSFLGYGLRKSSWSKLSFYQTRTGTRFAFYMMNSSERRGKVQPNPRWATAPTKAGNGLSYLGQQS